MYGKGEGERKTMPISLIATAIGLGMAYAAAPGAVNTEALRRGVRWEARSALLVETGALRRRGWMNRAGSTTWPLLLADMGR
jgi:hypothetical protein